MGLPRNQETDALFQAVLLLRDREECYRFFEDLCTIQEVSSISQRLLVARRLQAGCSNKAVAEETGVSSATICRVNRCLTYGAGGYDLILTRMKGEP